MHEQGESTVSTAFDYTSLPMKIRFGVDAFAALPEEAARLGMRRILMIGMPDARSVSEIQRFAAVLGEHVGAVFSDAAVHVPVETLNDCIRVCSAASADGIVAVGGGSAIGLGKLVSAATSLPMIAIPTTYSGAEMTPVNAVTENGVKAQRRDEAMLPKVVIYDPALTTSLPLAISSASIMNAMAHAIEAIYAPDSNPIVRLVALESIRLARQALPRLVDDVADRAARADLLQSSMMAGQALSTTTMSLHHKLCHILGGAHDLPHAEVNAVILPYAVAFNIPGAPAAFEDIARALGAADPAQAIFALARDTGSPTSLHAIGMNEEHLDAAAEVAAGQSYDNPVSRDRGALRALLDDAYHGRGPRPGGYPLLSEAA